MNRTKKLNKKLIHKLTKKPTEKLIMKLAKKQI